MKNGGERLQYGFAIGPDNSLQPNLIDQMLSRFNQSVDVHKLVFSRRIWSEIPKEKTAIVDLLSDNRQLHFLDESWNLYGSRDFKRGEKISKLAMAVVMAPNLNDLSQGALKADLEPLVKQLSPKGGGLIVVERVPEGDKPDKKVRGKFLEGLSNKLIKPNFLIAYQGLCLWETRKPLPNNSEDFKQVSRYNRAARDLAEQVGVHYFEDSEGNLIVTDWGAHTETIIRIAGENVDDFDRWKAVGFESRVDLPELTESQKKLRWALTKKADQDDKDRKKFLITEEIIGGEGILLPRHCPSGSHQDSQPLTAALRKVDVQHGHLKTILVDVACGHCDYVEPPQHWTVRFRKRTVDGKEIKGWVVGDQFEPEETTVVYTS